MKRMLTLLLTLIFCIGLLTACGGTKDEIPTEDVQLWVVTELMDRYGMNDQANKMIRQFQEKYPNVKVKLDILPTDEEERAVYLHKLRTQIMGGGGPDVYLMPTNNVVPAGTSMEPMTKNVEPLFRDVGLTMHNGLFYDISDFYDTDDTLEKEELNTSVMDGGVVDGARYVLPLRYDIGVYLVDRENFEALGGDVTVFDGGSDDVMRLALEIGDSTFATYASPNSREYYFSGHYDYPSGSVQLTVEEVEEYLELIQAVNVVAGTDSVNASASLSGYIRYNASFFASEGYGLTKTYLSSLLNSVCVAQILGESIEIYPMRANDGTLNAIVRYYAAVGAGARYPQLAYEFIKLFLGEEAQYESYMTGNQYKEAASSACDGWPVRTIGSVAPRLEISRFQWENTDVRSDLIMTARKNKFLKAELDITDDDIPALTWQVDEVMFPIIMEAEDNLQTSLLNDFLNNNAALDADINAIAQEYIDNLQLYLDEG